MKNKLLFTFLFIVLTIQAYCKNYYFSPSGNDNNAGTQAAPFASIPKFNSIGFVLGDTAFFQANGVWQGQLILKNQVKIFSYGFGKMPIITGLQQVTSWTNQGNGLWTSILPSGLGSLNIVTIDGNFQAMGKFPKGNQGYFSISAVGTNSLSSNSISGLPSFVGGEICWRPYHWVLWRGTVTAQTSTTVSYSPFPSTSGGNPYPGQVGYGFFFQNHPSCCTQAGEWAYNSLTKVFSIYMGTDNPSAHVIKVSVLDYLLTNSYSGGGNAISGIDFEGANNTAINLNSIPNITVQNCQINNSGIYGIFGNGISPGWKILNNSFNNSNSIAIYASSSTSKWIVSGNNINNTGSVAGMGGSGENQYFGIKGPRNGSVISYNIITNSGYIPLSFGNVGSDESAPDTVSYNWIQNFGFVKDDAGGIYFGRVNGKGSYIGYNFVTGGVGSPIGTPDHDPRSHGIYLDDGANNLNVFSNTVWSNGEAGFYCHGCHEINYQSNLNYDNGFGFSVYNDLNTCANLTLLNNEFFAKTASQFVWQSSAGASLYFKQSDRNFWCRPLKETSHFLVGSTSYDLKGWQNYTKQDGKSQGSPFAMTDTSKIIFSTNYSGSKATLSCGDQFTQVDGWHFGCTYVIFPYGGFIYLKK